MFSKGRRLPFLLYLVIACMSIAIILYFVRKSEIVNVNAFTLKTLTAKVRLCNCSFPHLKVKTNVYRLVSSVDLKSITLHGYGSWDSISRGVEQNGNFEPQIDKVIYYFLKRNPTALFIDLGANIGVRSLQVAKYGIKVIAVEALLENVYRLCRSIKDSNVSDEVRVIHNAIAERQKTVQIGRYAGCMGCSFVTDDKDVFQSRKKKMEGLFEEKIPAVTLDDLLQLEDVQSSNSIFMKMDIEGYEHHVFDGAGEFFKSKDVIGIIMEWTWHKGLDSGLHIFEFMKKNNFLPFMFNDNGDKYDLLKWVEHKGTDFPADIIWLSSKYVYQVI